MSEDALNHYFYKKSYEISYALFRLASAAKPSFAESLEKQALDLLESSTKKDRGGAKVALGAIEVLVKFGADVNLISIVNAELLINEAKELNSAIAGLPKAAMPPPVNLEDVFSKNPTPADGDQFAASANEAELKSAICPNPELNNVAENSNIHGNLKSVPHSLTGYPGGASEAGASFFKQSGNSNGQVKKSEGRQSAIFERIRQCGNLPDGKAGCRLKEMQELLPEVSERTLRYDLQDLVGRGLIERVGSGGPATYYRAKTENTAVTFGGEQAL
jgi:hypothetical protein